MNIHRKVSRLSSRSLAPANRRICQQQTTKRVLARVQRGEKKAPLTECVRFWLVSFHMQQARATVAVYAVRRRGSYYTVD